jgi:hypothetical protein
MNCCICGTVRNCGPYLDKIFINMERISTLFNKYKIFMYYDKSNDNTLNKIKQYKKKNPNFFFYENNFLLQYRTHRLALGRNKCLEFIQNECNDYEYFIMMDCDDRCAKDIRLPLLSNYLLRNDWDCLTFNHPDGYYDSWALSIFPFVLSCDHFKDRGQGKRMIEMLIKLCPKESLISCFSAFNGLGIYRKIKFINCQYNGLFCIDYIPKKLINENIRYSGKIISTHKEDCEHRAFHIEAIKKNKAMIRISPHKLFI